MAREATFPGVGRLRPASYKALGSVKEFMVRYGGPFGSNASNGTRSAIRRLCELSSSARLMMGEVSQNGVAIPPGIMYEVPDAAAPGPIEDMGVDVDASTKYGEVMVGGSVTLSPAEQEFLKRLGNSVGGGLRIVVQELVRHGDERACQILYKLSQEQFVPQRWVEIAAMAV